MAGLGGQPSAPTRMGQQQAAPTRMGAAQPVLGTSPNMSSHHPGPAASGTGTSNYSRAIFDAQVSFKKCDVLLAPSP
jgi:hypothetical protein